MAENQPIWLSKGTVRALMLFMLLASAGYMWILKMTLPTQMWWGIGTMLAFYGFQYVVADIAKKNGYKTTEATTGALGIPVGTVRAITALFFTVMVCYHWVRQIDLSQQLFLVTEGVWTYYFLQKAAKVLRSGKVES